MDAKEFKRQLLSHDCRAGVITYFTHTCRKKQSYPRSKSKQEGKMKNKINHKVYKYNNSNNISMLPGNLKRLPDEFFILINVKYGGNYGRYAYFY